jgi:hypothetical protein
MCTLTVVPKENGYYLAMNRDERTTRGFAAPPVRIDVEGVEAVYPRETEGGTWVAANDCGIALALLNWNDTPHSNARKIRSRGQVIPELIRLGSHRDVETAFNQLDLNGIFPFRLVGIFPLEREISEWRWNLDNLDSQVHQWEPGQWFSSSLSDEQASLHRGEACRSAWREKDAGSLPWLRKLHAAHDAQTESFQHLCPSRERGDAQLHRVYLHLNPGPLQLFPREPVYHDSARTSCGT